MFPNTQQILSRRHTYFRNDVYGLSQLEHLVIVSVPSLMKIKT